MVAGRLTLTTLTPVPLGGVSGATTIYFTPYNGNQIAIYNGSSWDVLTLSEVSIAVGTKTNATNYDIFGFNSSGVLTLEFSAAWNSDTTIFSSGPYASARPLQDGVPVKSTDGTTIDATRRYLGTVRTSSTTTVDDTSASRWVFNQYNRVARAMISPTEGTASWSYSTASYRQANANANNQLDYVSGDKALLVTAVVHAVVSSSTVQAVGVGIGQDSTTVNGAANYGSSVSTTPASIPAYYYGYPGLGRHVMTWLESGAGSGTQTWYGTNSVVTRTQSGITGWAIM
jgi:hypothetical protein